MSDRFALNPLLKKKKKEVQPVITPPTPTDPTKRPVPKSATPQGMSPEDRKLLDQGGTITKTASGEVRRLTREENQNINRMVQHGGKPLNENVAQRLGELHVAGFKTPEEILQEEQRAKGATLAQGVGQLDPNIVDQAKAGNIDIGQIIGGGLSAAVPGVAGGAAVGALAGGVGAIPGAVIGGVGAFLAGARSSLKSQRSGNVAASSGNLGVGQTNLRKYITAANRDPANAATYSAEFNQQLSYIQRDYGNLNLDTQGFLKDLSGVDGTPQLADYQLFFDQTKPYYELQMTMALMNPDPSKTLLTPQEEAGIE